MVTACGISRLPTTRAAYLLLEDFGTIGLTGDPEEHQVVDGVTDRFLNFFRAEGRSDKGERSRKLGVGKTVFPRASRISSYFGFTVRVIRIGNSCWSVHPELHRINGDSYKSDGCFGGNGRTASCCPP